MAKSEVIPLPISSLARADDPSSLLALPVNIVPEVYSEPLALGLKRAEAIVVTDAASYRDCCELVNMLKKFDSTIEGLFLDAGRPLREAAAKITAEGKAYRSPIQPAYELASRKAMTWKKLDDARVEAARLAAEQEQQRQAAEEQARADEKARLEREAKVKEELAARQIERIDELTPAQAKKALAAGEEAQALRAQAEAIVVPASAPFVAVDILPTKVHAKGVRTVKKVTLLGTDVSKLPAAYLLPNEALIKKHIADGVIAQGQYGTRFLMEDVLAATGR